MTMHTPLLELTRRLIADPGERAAFGADPAAFLARHGVDGFQADEIADALGFAGDSLPTGQATQLAALEADHRAADGPGDLGDLFGALTEIDAHAPGPLDDLDDGFSPQTDVWERPGETADQDPTEVDGDKETEPPETTDLTDHDHGLDHPSAADPPPAEDTEDGWGDQNPTDPYGDPDFGAGAGPGGPSTTHHAEVGHQSRGTPEPSEPASEPRGIETADPAGADPSWPDEGAFLPPHDEPQPPSEPDELDADNGDWDGDWDHLDGHGIL